MEGGRKGEGEREKKTLNPCAHESDPSLEGISSLALTYVSLLVAIVVIVVVAVVAIMWTQVARPYKADLRSLELDEY